MRVELHRPDAGAPSSTIGSFIAFLGKKGRREDPDTFKETVSLLRRLSSERQEWGWAYVLDTTSILATAVLVTKL